MKIRKFSFFHAQSGLNFIVVVLMLITILTWRINKKVLQSSSMDPMLNGDQLIDVNLKSTNLACKPKTKIGFLKIHKAASRYVLWYYGTEIYLYY